MFQFLKRLFRPAPPKPRLVLPQLGRSPADTPRSPAPGRSDKSSSAAARDAWAREAARPIDASATPEELCGISPDMPREQIAEKLAALYRRHNRAASSLEAHLREEAEFMLEVIAAMKQKYGA